jgi:alpha-beta hydrolase superfamily lysophospholipase
VTRACESIEAESPLSDAAAALTLARTRARERDVPLVVFGHGAGGLVP